MRTKDKTVHFRLKRCKTSRFRLKRREPSRLSPTLSSEEVLRAGSLSSEEVSLSALTFRPKRHAHVLGTASRSTPLAPLYLGSLRGAEKTKEVNAGKDVHMTLRIHRVAGR